MIIKLNGILCSMILMFDLYILYLNKFIILYLTEKN